jgi:chromosome segregation ATPase
MMAKKKTEPTPWIASMGADQLEKRLTWLDETRRSEAEAVARLRERVEALEETRAKGESQLKDVAGELTRLATIASRINQFDEALSKHRVEVSRHLEQAEKRRSEKEANLEDIRKRDQAAAAKELASLKKTVSRIDELDQSLEVRRQEEIRLTRTLKDVSERINDLTSQDEGQARSLATFEEGRKQDARRVGDLQQEMTDLARRVEALHGAIDSSSDRIRRLEVQMADLVSAETERAEGQTVFLEQQSIKMAEFERFLKEWQENIQSFESREVRLDEQAKVFDESLRSLKQSRSELDTMLERLERRIAEISEIQRLAEDRVRQEWSSFQADDQKRWSGYKLTFDEHWREHDRLHDRMTQSMESQEESIAQAIDMLGELSSVDRQRLMDLLAMVKEWASELERKGEEVG